MINRNRLALGAAGMLLSLIAAADARAQPASEWRFPYDVEYPTIGYRDHADANRVARLAERLERGDVRLEYEPGRGYLDSLLEALEIDPSSQVLVFSKTSLQEALISPAKPRAIYFNDDVYIGWVQGGSVIEIMATDAERGTVFYTLSAEPGRGTTFDRRNNECLSCHDSQSLLGGGLPNLIARSAFTEDDGSPFADDVYDPTTDETPLAERWGGWYVTGLHGDQVHLGNMLFSDLAQVDDLDGMRRGNLSTLEGAGFFDTTPYLTATSDIVALLVLEHQLTVQNQITRVKFKAPFVLASLGHGDSIGATSWDELPPDAQAPLTRMLDALVQRLLLVDAAPLGDRIEGTSGFDAWFEAQGPRDAAGRSLRELDLESGLFKYPLSHLVYSPEFDGLPPYAKDYVYRSLAAVLEGRDESDAYSRLSADDRRAIQEILLATKPEYARFVEATGG